MRVLFASRRPVYPLFHGGAERSFYELARALAEAGHGVALVGECSAPPATVERFFTTAEIESRCWDVESAEILGRSVPGKLRLRLRLGERFEATHTFLADYRKLVEDLVWGFDPDIICTQLEGATDVVGMGAYLEADVLYFVRDTFSPSNDHVLGGRPGGRRPAAVIANSRYTAEFVRRRYGIDAEVLYPIVRLAEGAAEPAGDGPPRLLFVNPQPYKGGDLMYEVASRLGDLRFVVVPGWGKEVPDRWRTLGNAEVHRWPMMKMEDLYASSDLVLLPTQQSEGFGRVAVEAQLSGTPVLASHHSALAEVLGPSAFLVERYDDPAAWVREIRCALESGDRLRERAQAGRVHAARFAPEPIRERFEEIVAGLRAPA